jgi:iron complex outermembrane receptor protein
MNMFSQGNEPSIPRAMDAGFLGQNVATAGLAAEGRLVRQMRRKAFSSAGMAALVASLVAVPALAQTVSPTTPEPATVSEIVVTGTRIQTTGFTAPTPTSVIGEAQIQNNAQPNIFATIVQLPSLQGSSGSATNTFSTSSGQQGLSSFSLRGLGTIRTLTLLDGQRVVGAYYTGVTDVSLFPQLLIQRVDVVNGGASASYGSDAVGGVVNFITDTRFKG